MTDRARRRSVVIDELVEERRGYSIRKVKRYKEGTFFRIYQGTCIMATPQFTLLGSAQDWCDRNARSS